MITFNYLDAQLILPSPRLNDSDSLELQFHMDRAMSGKIYAYKKQTAAQRRLSLFFEHCNRPKVLETIGFLRRSMGKIIEYVDYENNKWKGVVLTSPFTETHVDIHNNQFTIIFEGVIVP